jgi:toxin ParE1/3/4
MGYPVLILDSAKDDFREIRAHVKGKHGDAVWDDVNRQFKTCLGDIGQFPLAGIITEEAQALGLDDIRQRLVGQIRVIYQFDGEQIVVHMFVSTLRDFVTRLSNRLLSGRN